MSAASGPKIYGLEKMVLCLDGGNSKSARSFHQWYDLSKSGSYFTASIASVSYSSSYVSSLDGYYFCSASYMTDRFTARSFVGTSSFTIGVWVNFLSLNPYAYAANTNRLIQKAGFPNSYWNIDITTTNFELELRDSAQVSALSTYPSSTPVANTNYYYVTVTDRSAGVIRFYRNASQVATRTISSSFDFVNSTGDLTFPASFAPAYARMFRGELYMKALTEDEIRQNWFALRGRYGF